VLISAIFENKRNSSEKSNETRQRPSGLRHVTNQKVVSIASNAPEDPLDCKGEKLF